MDSVFVELLTQWGLAGIVMLAAGYIIWDNYKTNKQRLNGDGDSRFNAICEKLDSFKTTLNDFKSTLDSLGDRITKLESKENDWDLESKRMVALSQLGPSIHSILKTNLDNCDADHLYLASFHNGKFGITGIPYIKFDVISEAYSLAKYPGDVEMIKLYNNEDIIHHNKLASILMQHSIANFSLDNDKLNDIDSVEYKRYIDLGVKHVSYISIRDLYGRIAGYLCAYSFDKEISQKEFIETAVNIEEVYKNIAMFIENPSTEN